MDVKGMAESATGDGCIFCDIVTKKAKSFSFWQDDDFIAFLSIYPNTSGVSVVIPKTHYSSDVFSLPNDCLIGLVFASKKVSEILSKLPGVGRVAVVFEGFGINHAHAKLFPMHGTKMQKWAAIKSNNTTIFEKYEGYISSHDGPRENDLALKKIQEELICLNK